MEGLATWTSDSRCVYHGNSLNFRLGLVHDGCLLFEPTDFSLVRRHITGLVGTNGSGKTSLARVLASKSLPGFPKDLAVQYVSSHENHIFAGDEKAKQLTPAAYLNTMVDERLARLQTEIDRLEGNDDDGDEEGDGASIEEAAENLAKLCEQYDDLQQSSKQNVKQTLEELGFAPHLHKAVSQLSSGWRYKCRLAGAFTAEPDILIIDEPSFLDASAMKWMVRSILRAAESKNAMVIVISHKESLLESLCDRILYINSGNHSLSSYNCDYRTFRSTHKGEISNAERTCGEYEKKLNSSTKSLKSIQTQLQKRERNLKKTTTKNSDQRFIKGKNKEAKQKADRSAAARVKQLKKEASEMEKLRRQAQREKVKELRIPGVRATGTLVELKGVDFAYENEQNVFHNLNLSLEPSDRVLLTGPNGCGKSTLLKIILGELTPNGGTAVANVKPLYFPQTSLSELTMLHGKETSVSYLGSKVTEHKARQHLGDFGLGGDVALRPVITLSAGQRVRLWLARELLDRPTPSLLVMDEISENLDIETRQSLSDVLNSFIGAVILVSHDEDFCHKFKPTQIWNLVPSSNGRYSRVYVKYVS